MASGPYTVPALVLLRRLVGSYVDSRKIKLFIDTNLRVGSKEELCVSQGLRAGQKASI